MSERLTEIEISALRFDDQELIPAIIQDANSLQVLMLGYMNKESLGLTIKNKQVTFWSRSKSRIWVKGETSGNFLTVVNISADCDSDAILIQALPTGPTCHTGENSCFGGVTFEE